MEQIIKNDLAWEHSQHKNMVKGIMGRQCSECWKEHLQIKSRSLKKSIPEPLYTINDYRISNA